jgi:hypothetical protein
MLAPLTRWRHRPVLRWRQGDSFFLFFFFFFCC